VEPPPQTTPTTEQPLWRWLSRAFVILGFLWIGWLLAQEGRSLSLHLIHLEWRWLIVSLLVGSMAVLPNALIFHLLLVEQPGFSFSLAYVVRLMFVGQLVRHLPGRFWGVAYQIQVTRQRLSPLITLKVNIDFTLIFLAFNTLFPVTIILKHQLGLFFALVFFILGSYLLALGLRLNWARTAVALCQRWLPQRLSHSFGHYLTVPVGVYSWRTIGCIWLLLVLGWLCYLLAWQTFTRIFPLFGDVNMLLLCATYSIAWVVGFLSMVTPAGLGVREAAFVFIAAPLTTPANIALLALFVRVWLLVIDLLLFLLVLPFGQDR
jgi:glycosyltransferase 2 family protein